ncbi:peptide-methionine (S)-S-oxide reductase MsrA [Candidatus Daviesbacteria bacterium]|nr:peptide-methionine (S)-S-oxide reductase MsrA [Candidatus Daviesbacteria bacterium]
MQTITLAGGCFWCTEAIFKRLKGVKSVVSGYAGGDVENPTYQAVSSGTTGHAEAIQIKFDPKIIPLEKILDIFWHLINPTSLNKQGADIGTQYRSVIFYQNNDQKKIAEASRKKIEQSGLYTDPIVTKIEQFKNFYPAESYHQNYYERNYSQSYCQLIISPKIEKLIKQFGESVKN